MLIEGWDVIIERVEKLGLHIDVGTMNWMTMILDHAEQLKAERDGAEAKLEKAVEALDEAIYMLAPDEKDMEKKAGIYRIVTAYEELKGEKDE